MGKINKGKFTAAALCALLLLNNFAFAQNVKQVSLDLKTPIIKQLNQYDNSKITGIDRTITKGDETPVTIKLMEPFTAKNAVFQSPATFFYTNFQNTAVFTNSKFKNDVDFSNSVFTHKSDFSNDTFTGPVDFTNDKFQKRTFFAGSIFDDNAEFSGSIYEQNATFNDIKFNQAVDFSASVFVDKAFFSADSFMQTADFSGNKFWQTASFDTSVFEDDVSFSNDTFYENANFTYTVFSCEKIDFSSAVFFKKASFRNLSLEQYPQFNFKWALLPDTLDFSYNGTIPNVIDLSEAKYPDSLSNKKIWIYLHKSDLSKFILDYRYFGLLFQDPIDGTCLSNDKKDVIYEGLLKNFSDHGQWVSYQKLDREYQRYKHYIAWPLMLIWWNYGYNKELVFAWILGFTILFTCITRIDLCWLNTYVYEVPEITLRLQTADSRSLWWHSFVYTGIIFFSFTLNLEKLKMEKWYGIFYVIIVYMAGILCLAYAANFVLK